MTPFQWETGRENAKKALAAVAIHREEFEFDCHCGAAKRRVFEYGSSRRIRRHVRKPFDIANDMVRLNEMSHAFWRRSPDRGAAAASPKRGREWR